MLLPTKENNDNILIRSYRSDWRRSVVLHTLSVLLLGLPYILLYWYKQWTVLKLVRCSLRDAQWILIQDVQFHFTLEEVKEDVIDEQNCTICRYFMYKHLKYVWNEDSQHFQKLSSWDGGAKTFIELYNTPEYTTQEQDYMLKKYGLNEMRLEPPSRGKLLMSDAVQPFYVFQLFGVVIWCLYDYALYAVCVVVISVMSVIASVLSHIKQNESIERLASTPLDSVCVLRQGMKYNISSKYLVPGDIMEIAPNGGLVLSDMLLLSGTCIVNESMLTGESVPATKTPPPYTNEIYNSVIHRRHTLFSGTEVMQVKFNGDEKVLGLVLATGFSTAKGELIRSILHPKPIGFKFYRDSVKFLLGMFILSAIGIVYLVIIHSGRDLEVDSIVIRCLDLITIVVPPALPAAMSVGTVYSRSRLNKKGIFCTAPAKINICGKLKLMCFDKTGTLTEEGLNLWGILPSTQAQFQHLIINTSYLGNTSLLSLAMATCHSLTKVNGNLMGDPLDVIMFESINWELEEQEHSSSTDILCPTVVKPKNLSDFTVYDDFYSAVPYEVGIVRVFPFSSKTQSMSVITRTLGHRYLDFFCKGAPETIKMKCKPETVPTTYYTQLCQYTSLGYRVIAIAHKQFDSKLSWRKAQRAQREDLETELEFLGFVVMNNTVKEATAPVIRELKSADIRCVMLTGDNLETAISVSRDCGLISPQDLIILISISSTDNTLVFQTIGSTNTAIDNEKKKVRVGTIPEIRNYHYVLDGKTWALLRANYSEIVNKITVRATVFARMLPEQKTQVVQCFQEMDYIVGMCGDGANDCGALKTAHVGISLSQTESSIAAPFTSLTADISCVVDLVKEGRCALVTSFTTFRYMAMYSFIQFISVIILYTKSIVFSNIQFLMVDLLITTSLAIVIGRSHPASTLAKFRPIANLIVPANIVPLVLQFFFIAFFQLLVFYYLHQQKWFEPVPVDAVDEVVCWENVVIFIMSTFQYFTMALVYSTGGIHRKPFYKNILFTITLLVLSAFTTLLCVHPFKTLSELFELVPIEDDTPEKSSFRVKLLLFPLANFIVSLIIETSVANTTWLKNVVHSMSRKTQPKNMYKRIMKERLLQFYWAGSGPITI